MSFEAREYQERCVDAWISEINNDASPVVAVPTGAGKTVILCMFLVKWFETHPDSNVLVLSHTQEIVRQDYDALTEFFPSNYISIFSAGLGEKELNKIVVGNIQSVYRSVAAFVDYDLAVVDEAHTVNVESKGMYRSVFNTLGCKVAGMSATVFRTGQGYIYKGKNALFDKLAFDLTSEKEHTKLVEQGYLTKLLTKATEYEMDTTGVARIGGDFVVKQLVEKHDRETITEIIVEETIKFGKNYKKWLVFAIDIGHANHVHKKFVELGIDCDVLHSKTNTIREDVLHNFKHGKTRALVSVGMITTGFDAPNVDLIALMRPTDSPVLHIQMIGRGLRVAPGKDHCLVLDFAGNIERLGPIDAPEVIIASQEEDKGKQLKNRKPRMKTCPRCRSHAKLKQRKCSVCGYLFRFKTKLSVTPHDGPALSENDRWLKVDSVSYYIHNKINSPTSLKVSYRVGLQVFSEWVCFNHSGYPYEKALKWLRRRYPYVHSLPEISTEEIYNISDELSTPSHIKIKRGKFIEITNTMFGGEYAN